MCHLYFFSYNYYLLFYKFISLYIISRLRVFFCWIERKIPVKKEKYSAVLRVLFCWFCQNKTLNSAEKNSQYASVCGQSRQRNASFLLPNWEKNAAQWKNQFAAFPAEQGRVQWQKREGRGEKGLLREIFWQQKKKTEKFSFLYCEFYSEQKNLP